MIENANASKTPGESFEVTRYVGVGSVNVVAINPNNEKLRHYGWNIPENAEEPVYSSIKTDDNGKPVKNARVRFLVQVQDMETKPIIPIDFWCRSDLRVNNAGDKCQIIDAYGRTAWATKAEVTDKRIPVYENGNEANISLPYKPCHRGEEELVTFLMRYLNVTPKQVFDRLKGEWVNTKNPGRLTIDNWGAICNGDITEIANYISQFPDNCVKVVFGIRNTDDNKSYQTFLSTGYISNGSIPNKETGDYPGASRLITKFMTGRDENTYTFSASPIKEWTANPTEVKEQTGTMFDDSGNFVADSTKDDNDLPFGE